MHTREKILQGARSYLIKHGQAGFTVRAVAKEAEVNPGLVHHYYGSKENLILELMEKESGLILGKVRHIREEKGIEGMREALIAEFLSNEVVARLFVEAIIISDKSETVKTRLKEIIRDRRNRFMEVAGITDPIDKIIVQSTIFGLQLLKKIDPEISLEKTLDQFFTTFVIDRIK